MSECPESLRSLLERVQPVDYGQVICAECGRIGTTVDKKCGRCLGVKA